MYIPHHFYKPCIFYENWPGCYGLREGSPETPKRLHQAGLETKNWAKIEDGTPRKAGVKPDEGKVKQKGTSSGYLEHIISVKEEPDEPKVNSFVEVDDVVKEEVDDQTTPLPLV